MANPLQQVIQRSNMDKDKGESIFKETMRHVGLYAGLIAYTAVGAKVSYCNVTLKMWAILYSLEINLKAPIRVSTNCSSG